MQNNIFAKTVIGNLAAQVSLMIGQPLADFAVKVGCCKPRSVIHRRRGGG
jgi:hypothetical protein